MKVTIDRSKWGTQELYNPETGKFCALGFVGLACGYTPEELAKGKTPRKCATPDRPWPGGLGEAKTTCDVWGVNDWEENPDRERDLAAALAARGVVAEFV